MATAKSLLTPQVVEINGPTIRIQHPDISRNPRTQLISPIAAGGTTMSVSDNEDFNDDDFFIIGEVADTITEECDVNGAVTRGTALTVTNTLKFAHEINAPVTKIFERKITIYGASTDGGSLTAILGTGAAIDITWNRPYTEYTLKTTDTAFAFYVVKFYDGTTESAASDYIANTGLPSNSVQYIIDQALDLTNSRKNDLLTDRKLIRWTNDAQKAIAQYMYQDPQTGEYLKIDWPFEIVEDITSLVISTNENKYSLSSLTSALKETNSTASVISVRIGDRKPMEKRTIQDMDANLADKPRTKTSGSTAVGATSVVVDSNVEFSTSGTLYIGSQQITYTGKTGTTTFTGVPASGTGSVTAIIADDAPVWQGIQPAEPTEYTIFENVLILNKPPHSDYSGHAIKIRYHKALPDLTVLSDTTAVEFSNVLQHFVAARIYQAKGMLQEARSEMAVFDSTVTKNAIHRTLHQKDPYQYFAFSDPF